MKTYLTVLFGSVFLSLAVTPLVIWLAQRIKAVDSPNVRKVHSNPIPRIGGVAIFISTVLIVLTVLFLQNRIGDAFRKIQASLTALLAAATFIFLIGLIDDLKGLRALLKLMAQLFAAIIVCVVGIRIQSVGISDGLTLNFGWLSWPLTIFWIVGITNAVNLSDGLDGLAAGISAIACGVIAILAIHGGQVVMAVLMLALLGSLTGFLFFNFNPARIFMGDCGSLFLGFTIATASVLCSMKSSTLVGLALPILALGIPIFDTLFSMLRRFLERRSMFAPDRRHFHHRLVDLGFKQRHVVILIYIMTFLAASLGMFMMVARNISALIIFLCILLLLILAFRVVGYVRLRETITRIRARHAISREIKKETGDFENVELLFRNAQRFEDWWAAICEVAKRMNFAWVSLRSVAKDGSIDMSVWRMANVEPMSNVVVMTVRLVDNGSDTSHEFEIAISASASLETAGRRVSLFGRLIEEHDVPAVLSQRRQTQQVKTC
jgi:UDP-GlcNAc:undecaprenyl-phosphate GlcNAc-1-phosphate transferase